MISNKKSKIKIQKKVMQMSNDNIDGGKIFVWGQIGEMLKELDKKRLISIAEKNSNYTYSRMANDEILDLVRRMKAGESFDKIKPDIDELNELDNIFREIAEFLHEKPHDMLSIGSFITGELESKKAFLDLGYKYENH